MLLQFLDNNQINSAVNLQTHEKKRNDIAHGKGKYTFDQKMVDDLYFDLISLIISYNNKIESFKDLSNYLSYFLS